MSIITLSRKFLSGHPKAGQPTYFVEKFLNSIGINYNEAPYFDILLSLNEKKIKDGILTEHDIGMFFYSLKRISEAKHHTIRAGGKRKGGDKFTPAIWSDVPNKKSGKTQPYHSPQIIIAPDVEIKRIFEIQMSIRGDFKEFTGSTVKTPLKTIASNDGLELNDFLNWFYKPFSGQILCWNEKIKY